MRKIVLSSIAVGLLYAGSAHATSVFYDINQDPSITGDFSVFGSANWNASGGAGATTNANDGWIELTQAGGGQQSAFLFEDFDAGSVIKAITFEADLRIGNGTQNPADGFSVNYCRGNDPALASALANIAGGAPYAMPSGWATGPQCEANLPEEGTVTGISVGFDAWDSGGTAPYCDGLGNANASNLGPDIIGMSIRVDGILIANIPMPTKNGACGDATSLQTGPWDNVNFPNDPSVLCWARLKVVLDENAVLNVYWKGVQVLTNYQTTYFPSPGRLIVAGRTGGSNQNTDIDNIRITTIPAALALVGPATGYPDGFSIVISDSGASVVNPATVTAQLNGSPVTLTSVTKTGGTTTATYHGFPQLLAVGSTNSVFVTCQDTLNSTISGTKTFVEGAYSTLPAADAVTGVNTSLPGFTLLPWQSAAVEPNTVYWMLEQLAGLHGTNDATFTTPTTSTRVINYNNNGLDVGGPGDAGNFQTANGYPDAMFPGLPSTTGLTGNSALNAQCYLQFQAAGVYTMVVNSDDGFIVSEGKNPNDWFSYTLGSYNGGRGSSDTTFTIVVTNAGIYPVRMAWENGNGEAPGNGANCEWFTVVNGVKYLINDPSVTNTSGVKAFYSGPALPAYVSAVQPNPGSGNNLPDSVFAQLTDSGTTVSAGLQLYVNGALKSPSVTKVGPVTKVQLSLPIVSLLPVGANNAALVWSDSGGAAHSNYWTFTVAPYATLDPAQSTALGSQDTSKPGFVLKVAQVDFVAGPDAGDGMANQVDSANNVIAGLWFPYYGANVVDTSTAVTGNTWYWTNAVDFNIVTSGGDFPLDYLMPGIPGTGGSSENFAAFFQTYLVFPTAGFYRMGVSSDDGFRVSQGFNLLRQTLHVTGSSINTDVMATVSQRAGGANQLGVDLPVVPITAQVVNVDSNSWASSASAFPNVNGKIAAITTFNNGGLNGANNQSLAYIAQTNGALAVIFLYNPGWGTVGTIGGSAPAPITIPVLAVTGFGGLDQLWYTNGTITATIGASQAIALGSADYGKGMGWIDFGFVVPQAGVYPMNMIYEQGGGGAGLEWVTIQADGTRVLVNDGTNPASLAAFRAVTVQAPPTLSASKVGNTYQISYTGILRSSSTVNGTYNPVSGATSPYTIPTGTTQFYRSSSN